MKSAISIVLAFLLALPAAAQIYTSALNPDNSYSDEGLVGLWSQYTPGFSPADDWINSTNAAMLASPKLADLNGDGAAEMLMTTYEIVNPYSGGWIHAYTMSGAELPGYPLHLTGAPPGTPAIGDLDGDGDLEIVQGTWQFLYVFNADGSPVPGWPLPMYITQAVALADIDNNGSLEIIVPVSNEIRVYRNNGTLLGTLAIQAPFELTAAAVGDLEGDGLLEIVTASYQAAGSPNASIFTWHNDGRLVNGFPVTVAGSVKSPPALADINNDGQLEVIAGCWSQSATDLLYAIHFNGIMAPGWPVQAAYSRLSSPSVGDLNGDGSLEVIIGGWSTDPSGEKVYAFSPNGSPLAGFPVVIPNTPSGNINSTCAVGNLDADALPEILVKVINNVYALNHDGSIVPGFPILLDDVNHTGTTSPTPAIGNMDDDDQAEFFAASCFSNVILIDQPGGFIAGLNYWPTFRRNAANTGTQPLTDPPTLDITLIPPASSVIPPQGGVFNYTVAAERHSGPQQPFIVFGRMRNPDGTWSFPYLFGPVSINPPLNVWISRGRSHVLPGSAPAGNYFIVGYASPDGIQITDSSYFFITKNADSEREPATWDLASTESKSALSAAPNPFNPTTAISFNLQAPSQVNLKVYDTAGRSVATLMDGWQETGIHEATFDGSKLASGLYIVHLQAGDLTEVGKIMLIK